ELLERNSPAVPVRAVRLGRYRRDQLLAKRLAVTVEARLDDCGTQPEYARLPRRLENELAVASRGSGDTVGVDQVGVHSLATPIIESRVTSSASSTSDRLSVPSGRSG